MIQSLSFFSFLVLHYQNSTLIHFRILSHAASTEIENENKKKNNKTIQKYLLQNVYMENMRHLVAIFSNSTLRLKQQQNKKIEKKTRIRELFSLAFTFLSAEYCSIGFFHIFIQMNHQRYFDIHTVSPVFVTFFLIKISFTLVS